MAAYVTKAKIDAWLTAAGLLPADAVWAGRISDLLDAVNARGGVVRDSQDAALASDLAVSVSDYYKIRALAIAAGVLVQV